MLLIHPVLLAVNTPCRYILRNLPLSFIYSPCLFICTHFRSHAGLPAAGSGPCVRALALAQPRGQDHGLLQQELAGQRHQGQDQCLLPVLVSIALVAYASEC